MMTGVNAGLRVRSYGGGAGALHLLWGDERPAALVTGAPVELTEEQLASRAVQPLVEVLAVGQGRAAGNLRNTATVIGTRLRVTRIVDDGIDPEGRHQIRVQQADPVTGVEVTTQLAIHPGHATTIRALTTVHNAGTEPLHLQAVSSIALTGFADHTPDQVISVEGTSEWVGENRWERVSLASPRGVLDLDLARHQHQDGRGAHVIAGFGAWSSGARVPSGILTTADDGLSLGWQVEHNGAWRVELAERLAADGRRLMALVALGPTDLDHHWLHTLAPGRSFTTVPVALSTVAGDWQQAVAGLTAERRRRRVDVLAARPNPRSDREPFVVFNDYMNTLMGDPTTDKLLPLVDAAAEVGAEVFCIDAGWYDDGGDWWDSVGAWEPSQGRFPGGLSVVTDRIRERGMTPGLWLEPEVIGVRSPLAAQLPDEAFLLRRGQRIVEHDRYLVDLRHPDAVKRLDAVVDRLVEDFGIGYFKLDYNVTPGAGTDRDADSVGDGLLEQNRAQAAWVEGLRRRHPRLQIENCASGAMRADDALLSVSTLQSTSDQQNALLYPPIASGALMSILPEQAANWAYPQPEMTEEEVIFTLCTGLSGRLYMSGHLDRMTAAQRELVAEAVRFARTEEGWLHRSRPIWPLGLPLWQDLWVASALTDDRQTLAVVWQRGDDRTIDLDLPPGEIEVAFPAVQPDPWRIERLDDGRVRLTTGGDEPQARVLRVRHP